MSTPASTVAEGAPGLDEGQPTSSAADHRRLLAIAVAAVAATVVVVADWESPLRIALVLAFLLFGPGLAIAELVAIRDPMQRLAIATGASLAAETLVASGLLYAGLFSPEVALVAVAGLTCVAVGIALHKLRARHAELLTHAAP